MKNIETLVAELSGDVLNGRTWQRAPIALAGKLLAVLAIYGAVVQALLGFRPDLYLQTTRLSFDLEIVLLAILALSSVAAAVTAMYPDAYQKPGWLKLPYAVAGMLAVLIFTQMAMPLDARMVIANPGAKAMDCALCIGSVVILPSALLFGILRMGATVRPIQTGVFAVSAASAIGCLTLRLAEMNDSLMHVAAWHYLPTFIFATVGAAIGNRLLRW